MENFFIPYKLAVIAKEKGFDGLCIACYDKLNMLATYTKLFQPIAYNNDAYCISAPTYQQIIDWFRDKHDIVIYSNRLSNEHKGIYVSFINNEEVIESDGYYYTLAKAIEKAFNLI